MTHNEQTTLKPCKFCGGESMIEEFRDGDDPQPLFVATCKVCPVKTYDQFSADEAARIWNEFVTAASTAPVAAQRRLEIALRYIKRAANRGLPKLPCRVDEMTEREVAIFNVGAAAVGNLQFIARELDALPAATTAAPVEQSDVEQVNTDD